MKFLLLALVAVASAQPDSDSDSFYGNTFGLRSSFGYGLPASTYGYGVPATTYGVAASTYGVPATTYGYGVPAATYANGYLNNQQYFGLNRFVKRDAGADAGAEPYYPLGYAAYAQQYPMYNAYSTVAAGEPVFKSGNFHTNLRNVVNGAKPQAYGTVGQVYRPVYNTAQRYFAKRDADSDSDAYSPFVSALYPTVRSTYYPAATGYAYNTNAAFYNGVNTPVNTPFYNYNQYALCGTGLC